LLAGLSAAAQKDCKSVFVPLRGTKTLEKLKIWPALPAARQNDVGVLSRFMRLNSQNIKNLAGLAGGETK
jgi:hypothetical protein